MSYYETQQWTAAAQPSWEQQNPPARSGTSSVVPREDSAAFMTQLEEVDRAIDNLMKSGKLFNLPGRRDTIPVGGPRGAFSEQFDPHMGGASPRNHSIADFGDARSHSGSNLQNFYANQRHVPSRGTNEAEQVMQAKRRMAAQRERELRNYHQEQQYNRSVVAEISNFGGKTDRTLSPSSGMSEEERRDLIARQRNALFEENSFSESTGLDESGNPRSAAQGTTAQGVAGIRGHSPLAFDNLKPQADQGENAGQHKQETQTTGHQRSRANSTSSPSSNPTSNFSLFDTAAQQSSRTSTSSPGGSPPCQGKAPTSSGVAPIGTRPGASQAANPALNKRSTTPLPSPLSYGYAANDEKAEPKDGHASVASNSNSQGQQDVSLGWGNKTGVWGKNSLGVQASVWG